MTTKVNEVDPKILEKAEDWGNIYSNILLEDINNKSLHFANNMTSDDIINFYNNYIKMLINESKFDSNDLLLLSKIWFTLSKNGLQILFPTTKEQLYYYNINQSKILLYTVTFAIVVQLICPFLEIPTCEFTNVNSVYIFINENNYPSRFLLVIISIICVIIQIIDLIIYFKVITLKTFLNQTNKNSVYIISDTTKYWVYLRIFILFSQFIDFITYFGVSSNVRILRCLTPLLLLSRRENFKKVCEGLINSFMQSINIYKNLLIILLLYAFIGFCLFRQYSDITTYDDINTKTYYYSHFYNIFVSFYTAVHCFISRPTVLYRLEPIYLSIGGKSLLYFVSLTLLSDILIGGLIIATGSRYFRDFSTLHFKRCLKYRKYNVIGIYILLSQLSIKQNKPLTLQTFEKFVINLNIIKSTVNVVDIIEIYQTMLSTGNRGITKLSSNVFTIPLTTEISQYEFFKLCGMLVTGIKIRTEDEAEVQRISEHVLKKNVNLNSYTKDILNTRRSLRTSQSDSISNPMIELSNELPTVRFDESKDHLRNSSEFDLTRNSIDSRNSRNVSYNMHSSSFISSYYNFRETYYKYYNIISSNETVEYIYIYILLMAIKLKYYSISILSYRIAIFSLISFTFHMILLVTMSYLSERPSHYAWYVVNCLIYVYFIYEYVIKSLTNVLSYRIYKNYLIVLNLTNFILIILLYVTSTSASNNNIIYDNKVLILLVIVQTSRLMKYFTYFKGFNSLVSIVPIIIRSLTIIICMVYTFTIIGHISFCNVINNLSINPTDNSYNSIDDDSTAYLKYISFLNFSSYLSSFYTLCELCIISNWSMVMDAAILSLTGGSLNTNTFAASSEFFNSSHNKLKIFYVLFYFILYRFIMLFIIIPLTMSFIIQSFIKQLNSSKINKKLLLTNKNINKGTNKYKNLKQLKNYSKKLFFKANNLNLYRLASTITYSSDMITIWSPNGKETVLLDYKYNIIRVLNKVNYITDNKFVEKNIFDYLNPNINKNDNGNVIENGTDNTIKKLSMKVTFKIDNDINDNHKKDSNEKDKDKNNMIIDYMNNIKFSCDLLKIRLTNKLEEIMKLQLKCIQLLSNKVNEKYKVKANESIGIIYELDEQSIYNEQCSWVELLTFQLPRLIEKSNKLKSKYVTILSCLPSITRDILPKLLTSIDVNNKKRITNQWFIDGMNGMAIGISLSKSYTSIYVTFRKSIITYLLYFSILCQIVLLFFSSPICYNPNNTSNSYYINGYILGNLNNFSLTIADTIIIPLYIIETINEIYIGTSKTESSYVLLIKSWDLTRLLLCVLIFIDCIIYLSYNSNELTQINISNTLGISKSFFVSRITRCLYPFLIICREQDHHDIIKGLYTSFKKSLVVYNLLVGILVFFTFIGYFCLQQYDSSTYPFPYTNSTLTSSNSTSSYQSSGNLDRFSNIFSSFATILHCFTSAPYSLLVALPYVTNNIQGTQYFFLLLSVLTEILCINLVVSVGNVVMKDFAEMNLLRRFQYRGNAMLTLWFMYSNPSDYFLSKGINCNELDLNSLDNDISLNEEIDGNVELMDKIISDDSNVDTNELEPITLEDRYMTIEQWYSFVSCLQDPYKIDRKTAYYLFQYVINDHCISLNNNGSIMAMLTSEYVTLTNCQNSYNDKNINLLQFFRLLSIISIGVKCDMTSSVLVSKEKNKEDVDEDYIEHQLYSIHIPKDNVDISVDNFDAETNRNFASRSNDTSITTDGTILSRATDDVLKDDKSSIADVTDNDTINPTYSDNSTNLDDSTVTKKSVKISDERINIMTSAHLGNSDNPEDIDISANKDDKTELEYIINTRYKSINENKENNHESIFQYSNNEIERRIKISIDHERIERLYSFTLMKEDNSIYLDNILNEITNVCRIYLSIEITTYIPYISITGYMKYQYKYRNVIWPLHHILGFIIKLIILTQMFYITSAQTTSTQWYKLSYFIESYCIIDMIIKIIGLNTYTYLTEFFYLLDIINNILSFICLIIISNKIYDYNSIMQLYLLCQCSRIFTLIYYPITSSHKNASTRQNNKRDIEATSLPYCQSPSITSPISLSMKIVLVTYLRTLFLLFSFIYFFAVFSQIIYCNLLTNSTIASLNTSTYDDDVTSWTNFSNLLNFNNYLQSMFTLFEMMILGSWSMVMDTAQIVKPYSSYVFFYFYRLLVTLVILPLLLSFVIRSYIVSLDTSKPNTSNHSESNESINSSKYISSNINDLIVNDTLNNNENDIIKLDITKDQDLFQYKKSSDISNNKFHVSSFLSINLWANDLLHRTNEQNNLYELSNQIDKYDNIIHHYEKKVYDLSKSPVRSYSL